MLALRLALVTTTADVETDAYGHFAIGRALLLHDPASLAVHWVWLPGYHYVVWALLRLGVGFTGQRALTALVQAVAPFVLYDLVARRGGDDPERSRRVALLAALTWTVAPLANCLALSVQPETAFTLSLVLGAWALERRRALLAGALLAAACLFRYEAWGVLPALVVHRLWRGRNGPGLAAIVVPASAIACWIALRHRADGEWLVFLRETQRFAGGVRDAKAYSPLVDGLLVPLGLPPVVLGPAIVLLPLGLRRSIRAGWTVPAGVLAFLALSYVGHGALGLQRYFTALVPFACVAIADGARRLPEITPRITARAASATVLLVMALTTAFHLGWRVRRAQARDAELRRYEAEVTDG